MVKRKKGGGANWQDTYGDMVTLLLCFFVLLYSLSTLDQQKWEILIRSLNPDAITDVDANVGNDGQSSDPPNGAEDTLEQSQEVIDADIEKLYQALTSYVEEHKDSDATISVSKVDGHVFVSFNEAVFFDGDSSALRNDSKPVLDYVAGAISRARDSIDELRIIGNTARGDGINPNNVYKDRMLAAMRATEVLVYLQEKDVMDPARMVSVGYGEWRPIADNTTSAGRAENRRVEMIVTGKDLEQELDSVGTYYAERGSDGQDMVGEGSAPLMRESPMRNENTPPAQTSAPVIEDLSLPSGSEALEDGSPLSRASALSPNNPR